MSILSQYILKIKNLNLGTYNFKYHVDDEFFQVFNYDQILGANLSVNVELISQRRGFLLNFLIEGTVKVVCDRCLDTFDMDYKTTAFLNLEYADYESNEPDYKDTLKITRETSEINLAKHIYDFIVLGLPMKKIHPTDPYGNPTCDPQMLELIDRYKPKNSISSRLNLNHIKEQLN